LLQQFIQFFNRHRLAAGNAHFLAAVSGGLDSVVLCELCRQAGMNFSIAHCNFQLRGAESERDERFVRMVGERYGVDVFVKRFDTQACAAEKKISVQEAARHLRYEWFAELLKENGFRSVLLAHHADDAIETLLMNFFRGTGLQGMTSIPESNDETRVLRPLLNFRRKEILSFATENNLEWVEDSSNSSSKYTRNFFRNELIPAIKKVYPEADENLLNNIARFKEINTFYQASIEKAKEAVCEHAGAELRIPIRKLKNYFSPALLYEIIRPYGFSGKQVEEVIKLMNSASGKFIENKEFQIIKHGNWLVVASKLDQPEIIAIEKGQAEAFTRDHKLELKNFSKEEFSLSKSEAVAQLDARSIEFPLLLRKWKPGDYFYPLGMKKKKKLSRFFIDLKLPKNHKEDSWVIESNKKIIWVVGRRIDERFKIIPSTKDILVISWSSL
jgi:tRNA(Ile)-lysidine synthase